MSYSKNPHLPEVRADAVKMLRSGKSTREVGKGHICRIIFLNLVVDDEKVVSYKMTKAFSKLEKAQNVLIGRG